MPINLPDEPNKKEEAKPKMSDKKGVVHSTAKKDYSQSDTSKPGIDRSIWGLKDE